MGRSDETPGPFAFCLDHHRRHYAKSINCAEHFRFTLACATSLLPAAAKGFVWLDQQQ